MKHGIASLDVRQESIAQTLSCWGTFDETSNISHIEKGRHFAENKNKMLNKSSGLFFTFWAELTIEYVFYQGNIFLRRILSNLLYKIIFFGTQTSM